ncbi:polynucleotide adenylyltransferase PcnB [Atopomonas sediminilitoris]|uniref:polynucleotide adenylyltransferase PcnB n=1 Tax=Atopomonas sediminilitoris TaxID=2919919 RepID=UPI001F4D6624|nr:polynucleotide adenylyltransferase PcnB [Atopomonas sediminilitoris]MCJ8168839.1 polynucleotide adenylyltransferase PcnB [Atopomonas sediminilitoris]
MLKKLLKKIPVRFGRQSHRQHPEFFGPRQHPVRLQQISRNAITVVERLRKAGFEAYPVGGCVRDLLLGIEPKDFDVATSATPEQARGVFRNARLIGRRFKLVHVVFGRDVIEVATFRASHDDEDNSARSQTAASGRLLRDNVYGSLDQDAIRRDFTINALYFDIEGERILDHARGLHDIHNRLVRLIGNPEQRYQEDPVRMLRAVRFAAKLDFEIERHTATPIKALARLLDDIPSARLFDEVLKLFMGGYALKTFELMQSYNLFAPLFPQTAKALAHDATALPLIRQALANTDERIAQGKPVTPAFLFAALLWPAVRKRDAELQGKGAPALQALQQAAQEITQQQCQRTAIPKRFSFPMRDIWELQERLPRRAGKRADTLLENPRFRASYDFLLLREHAGEPTEQLGAWWTDYQDASDSQRREMIRDLSNSSQGDANKRRRGGRRRGPRKPKAQA